MTRCHVAKGKWLQASHGVGRFEIKHMDKSIEVEEEWHLGYYTHQVHESCMGQWVVRAWGKNLYKIRLNFHTTLNTPITIQNTSTKRLKLILKRQIGNKT